MIPLIRYIKIQYNKMLKLNLKSFSFSTRQLLSYSTALILLGLLGVLHVKRNPSYAIHKYNNLLTYYSGGKLEDTVDCNPGVPCVYPETVNLRIIVITYNRAVSLRKLLDSLDKLELDGDSAFLEIWIDRKKNGQVDNTTLEAARSFSWSRGPVRVHVQKKNVGIMGQWIDTWSPGLSTSSPELALILEDDISVSPFVYRWIKAVQKHYGERGDYFGSTLQSDEQKAHAGGVGPLIAPKNHTAFLYKCLGTWGFAPNPVQWKKFQHWFHKIARPDPNFHPYVSNLAPTRWYKSFEASGHQDSMWSMWAIYFTYHNKLFTAYNNLPRYIGNGKSCLSINRREVGLHYKAKGTESLCKLLQEWKDEYVKFPDRTVLLDWTGKQIQEY